MERFSDSFNKSIMTWKTTAFAVLVLCAFARADESGIDLSEEAGKKYLEEWDKALSKLTTESSVATWNYESNITQYNLERQLEAAAKLAKFSKEEWNRQYPWQTYKDPDTRRQFEKYSYLGVAALPADKFERLEKVIKEMEATYGTAKICDYKNATECDMHLEPEITERFAKSRDPNELKYLWEEWRKVSGRPNRKLFSEYVGLVNEAAKLNNFSDASQAWLKDYESNDFTNQLEGLWQQVRPLYVQLHAYVRRRLREKYGEDVVSKTGPIPAHLFGNMWAQSWVNVLNDTVPYPNKPSVDATPEMIEQKYTPLKMFKIAEEFFVSLGLLPMPDTFWKNSIIEKPADGRDLICHASAWDFYDGKDFRIKQCTRVNTEDLETIHHEMGHVQYFLQYKDQPIAYKEGANPGFHEAVGDVMALSVSTPKHLQKIGLLKNVADDQESDINQLFSMALSKVAFLPFGYLIDQWRWGVFQGKVTESNYNCKWWELREQYQGIQPPTKRSEDDFDPAAKYHIVASVPYIRYFVSFIIQFQFHKAVCIAADEFDPENPDVKPLHKCDIYQNKKAGELLSKMLSMGSSKPWPEAMEVLTGQRKMDAEPLLQYFSTLQTWLERENARTGEYIGWEPTSSTHEEERHYYVLEEPDDSSEDDNFEYSYAELVAQNANSFESNSYREKLQPWLNPLLRRSTVNQFERNKNVFNTKSPMTEENSGGYNGRRYRSHPVAREDAATSEPEVRYKPAGEEYGKQQQQQQQLQQQSPLSKLLYSLGASFGKPRASSPEKNPLQTAPNSNSTLPSDIIWNAEVMKMQAEEMLKAYDVKDNPAGNPEVTDPRYYVQEPNSKRPEYWYPVESEPKKTAKKSFMHYHYNVRTPVFYNTVVLKKPNCNSWMDETGSGKSKLTHMTEEELTERGYNDRWKTIKLVPVDRNRMIQFRQYFSDVTGGNVRNERKRSFPRKRSRLNNISHVYSSCSRHNTG